MTDDHDHEDTRELLVLCSHLPALDLAIPESIVCCPFLAKERYTQRLCNKVNFDMSVEFLDHTATDLCKFAQDLYLLGDQVLNLQASR